MFAAFDLSSDAILVLDHNLCVRYANESAVSCLEFESDGDLNGMRFFKHSILAGPKTPTLTIVSKIQN